MSTPIGFMCPTCKALMNAPPELAGTKVSCLKCGQRLQIPNLERSKTILAPLVGSEFAAPGVAGSSSAPQIAPGRPHWIFHLTFRFHAGGIGLRESSPKYW